jgi:hypothetical protein
MAINQTIKNTFGKATAVLSSATFITLATAVSANAQKANFAGEWKLNEQKSELGQFGGRFAAKKLKLNGDAVNLQVGRFSTGQGGEEVTTAETFNFEDKETESTVFGNSKKKTKAKWSDDGKSMNVKSKIEFERNGEKFEVESTEVWKLSEDGKTLTIDLSSTSSRGTNTMKLVYDKAS